MHLSLPFARTSLTVIINCNFFVISQLQPLKSTKEPTLTIQIQTLIELNKLNELLSTSFGFLELRFGPIYSSNFGFVFVPLFSFQFCWMFRLQILLQVNRILLNLGLCYRWRFGYWSNLRQSKPLMLSLSLSFTLFLKSYVFFQSSSTAFFFEGRDMSL